MHAMLTFNNCRRSNLLIWSQNQEHNPSAHQIPRGTRRFLTMRDKYSPYIEMAMKGAKYERAPNGDCHAHLRGFYGLKAQAKTEQECDAELRTQLRAWLTYRVENGLSIPAVGGLVSGIRSINSWYQSYWQLIVSLASFTIIIIAYSFYGVDPIQSYRETGDKIEMSKRYVEIGDMLLLRSEGSGSPEAQRAYTAALELYPANLDARAGLLKAQILDVEPGRNDYDIGLAQSKLSAVQAYAREDYYLSYVEGVIALNRGIAAKGAQQKSFGDKAKESFERSKRLKPEFTGNHLRLGVYDLYFHGPITARIVFQEAYDKNRISPAILTYLASIEATRRDFETAQQHLEIANTLANRRLETLIVLGDVMRNKSGKFVGETRDTYLRAAISRHKEALEMTKRPDLVRGVDYNEFFYTQMPKTSDPPTDALSPWPFSTVNSFIVLANYSLSFDYILSNQSKDAETAFAAGFALDACPNNRDKANKAWYHNQADYLIRERRDLSNEAKQWLLAKKERFKSCV